MKKMILFIGGPADGQVRAVSCDEEGRPTLTHVMLEYSHEPLTHVMPDDRHGPLSKLPKITTVEYRAELLMDKEGRQHFVYALPGTDIVQALIKGYRR